MQLVIEKPKNWLNYSDNKKIYVVSPAFGNSNDEINQINKFLEKWQIKPIIYQYQNKNTKNFLANNDKERLEELKNALYGEKSNIIACSRGGYGSARILPELLKLKKPKIPKLLFGFSDITSLHLALNNYWDIFTLHSPMLKQCAFNEVNQKSIISLYNIIKNKKKSFSYKIKPINQKAKMVKDGDKFPKLLGGNLSLIQTSISTKWAINNNKSYSMLIEEINEDIYKIDRMLNHLQNANIFDNCRAIFIGDIIKKSEKNYQKDLFNIINNFSKNLNIPVFSIANIGHNKNNIAILLGVNFYITKSSN